MGFTREERANLRHARLKAERAQLPDGATEHLEYFPELRLPSFGLRLRSGGSRVWVMRYRYAGEQRRWSRDDGPAMTIEDAYLRARDIRKDLEHGIDPEAAGEERERATRTAREAPTVADLCERFKTDHLPKKKASTQRDYTSIIDNEIVPALGRLKVADVTDFHVHELHRAISERAPYRANRTVAVLSKMFSFASKAPFKWRSAADNPAKGIERNKENKRQRFLSDDEMARLSRALAEHPDRQGANILRLLLFTGARRAEAESARWAQFDLSTGVWTKPAASTKQGTEHRVPLSAPARQLLTQLHEDADPDAEFVFPSYGATGHRAEIKATWTAICEAAGLVGVRVHDLRHSYASVLAGHGLSLPVIGALLGHTQAQTTLRYAHLADDPLRRATETAGASIAGAMKAEILPFKQRR
jgi:integrase